MLRSFQPSLRIERTYANKTTTDFKMKPVSLVIELFVVLEHGQRANLCLARFTQTRGAASSFRKVVDIVEDVCKARCMLVEDPEKQAAMMEVLD
jgi:serine/threonine-protein kinase HSL1 (negative regulator of Swe1 kinase)